MSFCQTIKIRQSPITKVSGESLDEMQSELYNLTYFGYDSMLTLNMIEAKKILFTLNVEVINAPTKILYKGKKCLIKYIYCW